MNTVVDKVIKNKVHVVLLGAGASKASMPKGDKNGKIIPLMNELNKLPVIKQILEANEAELGDKTFEEFYSLLTDEESNTTFLSELNESIFNYFVELEILDEPTIYDYLLLSLRESDVIATFNWDPFIVQAYKRVSKITNKLPKVLFLHGTVALARCPIHYIVDINGNSCPKCLAPLQRIQLLYPTSSKDYDTDQYINEQWQALRHYLSYASGLTVFGYAAPKSDVAAIDLLKMGWGSHEDRKMEEIEIVNIDDEVKLKDSWREFIHTHHFSIHRDYFDSSIANFPRRVSEYFFCRFNLNAWLDNHKIERGLSFQEIESKVANLLKYENS
jgi:hypothetical protein